MPSTKPQFSLPYSFSSVFLNLSLSSFRICWQFTVPRGCNQNAFRMKIPPYISTPNLRQPLKRNRNDGQKKNKQRKKNRIKMPQTNVTSTPPREHGSASQHPSKMTAFPPLFHETKSSHYGEKLS